MEAARPATIDDVPRLVELHGVAVAELAPTRGGQLFVAREGRPIPAQESFVADLSADDHCVIAGTIDETVVGYAAGHSEAVRDGTRLGVVDDLFVEPEARGVAVGEAMLDHLLEWFRAQRCDGVDAHALPGNRATKNFFEGAGFSARLIVMHHRVTNAS